MSPRCTIFAPMIAVLAASAAAQSAEQISFVYEEIEWNWLPTKAKLEADFRRMVAEKGLNISAAEIAGAAQAAFNGGIMHTDSWDERQTVIRGCGPTKALCFVITCNSCTAR